MQSEDLDFKMSDRKALKKVVKTMFPNLNHHNRRVKEAQFARILKGKSPT